MSPSADTLQLTLSLAADATTDLAEISELTMSLYDEMQGSTTVMATGLAGQGYSRYHPRTAIIGNV